VCTAGEIEVETEGEVASGERRSGPRVGRPAAGWLLSGEWHYFRLSRERWPARLAQLRDEAGLEAVSVYVPWNWHEPAPGQLDMTGWSRPERDLRAALESIADAGLGCILRPGPFVTAEWRGGGIPDWWVAAHPEAVARGASGTPTPPTSTYPALTYAHPAFRRATERWLEVVWDVAADLRQPGGPVTALQLDDEPSYFQQLMDPFAVDYHPLLVDSGDDGLSAYARFLLARFGDLDRLDARYRRRHASPRDLVAPRSFAADEGDALRLVDWFAFKLSQIDDYVAFLAELTADFGVPRSVLQPYLLTLSPLLAATEADGRGLELTAEIYLSLFQTSALSEQKLGALLAGLEAARLWARPEFVVMELQASNASYLPPGAIELVDALAVARGARGVNHYMAVGGANPPEYAGVTGENYDLWAPIGPEGERRPHLAPIAKLSQMVRAWLADDLADARPVSDLGILVDPSWEAAVLSGAGAAFGVDDLLEQFDTGLLGLSDAASLPALLSLASIAFECVPLAAFHPNGASPPPPEAGQPGVSGEDGRAATGSVPPTLVLPGVRALPEAVEWALVAYVLAGGHLVVTPRLAEVDEELRPSGVLARVFFAGGGGLGETLEGPEVVVARAVGGSSGSPAQVRPGWATIYEPPPGAEVVAVAGRYGDAGFRPSGLRRRLGRGHLSLLGFPLRYNPMAGDGQYRFLSDLLPWPERPRVRISAPPAAGFLLEGPKGTALCLVNPTELPLEVTVEISPPPGGAESSGGGGALRLPVELPGVRFEGRGARLLPLGVDLGGDFGGLDLGLWWSSAEVVNRSRSPRGIELTLATPGGHPVEVVFEGEALERGRRGPDGLEFAAIGGVVERVVASRAPGGRPRLALVVRAEGDRVTLRSERRGV